VLNSSQEWAERMWKRLRAFQKQLQLTHFIANSVTVPMSIKLPRLSRVRERFSRKPSRGPLLVGRTSRHELPQLKSQTESSSFRAHVFIFHYSRMRTI
jgi:hypothetical protein